jgi:hypothetical protein
LRKCAGKEKLVILDFIGNHKSFLHKPLALFGKEARHLADFARKAQANQLPLPDGCYVNYDLELIDFLKSLDGDGIRNEYAALRDSLGRRPTLAEFYRSGSSMQAMRSEYQSWFALVEAMDDLDPDEQEIAAKHRAFLREVETTNMTKSFKMVLLEAFQELDGWCCSGDARCLATCRRPIAQCRTRPTRLGIAIGWTILLKPGRAGIAPPVRPSISAWRPAGSGHRSRRRLAITKNLRCWCRN